MILKMDSTLAFLNFTKIIPSQPPNYTSTLPTEDMIRTCPFVPASLTTINSHGLQPGTSDPSFKELFPLCIHIRQVMGVDLILLS